MARTWKSLQVTRQHLVSPKNNNLTDEQKKLVDHYYYDFRDELTPDEIYDKIMSIKLRECEVCGHDILIGKKCPGILPNNTLYGIENPTEFQIAHHKHYCKLMSKLAQERDNSYLVERNKSEKMRKIASKRMRGGAAAEMSRMAHAKYDGVRLCQKCGKEAFHLLGAGCMNCHNSSKLMVNVTRERNLKNWRDPEYAKRMTEVLRNNNRIRAKNIIKNKGKSKKRFIRQIPENDCKLHSECKEMFYDKTKKKYICWDCKKEEVLNNETIQAVIDFGYEIIPTFYYESDFWYKRNKFEEDLAYNKNVKWFSYVKFYIDAYGASRPLVAGKTGSLLVNKSGTDVSFSTNANDGKSRIFLSDSNLSWNTSVIAIKKFDLEKDAYKFETKTAKHFNLFYS